MAKTKTTTLGNGLRLHRISLEGTRAATVLVAFNAGARSERVEENGMAHFIEHLVFKGGQKYRDYRAINDAAEGIGAVINAYTSHDLVAFHITVRAEQVEAAADILCDFVARPRIDSDELERERGVVVQEIARANDQPSRVADGLIDVAAFGRHPLGRTVLGPAKNIKTFKRSGIAAFRKRRWGATGAAAFVVGNTSHARGSKFNRLFERFPRFSHPPAFEPATELKRGMRTVERDTNQSHLRLCYRPELDFKSEKVRAALDVYTTILGGSMGSRLFDEIREQRGLCYSIAAMDHVMADIPLLYITSGLDSKKCLAAYTRIKEVVAELAADGPRSDEFERAKSYTIGKTILAFESTGMVARHAARQAVVFSAHPDPERYIAALEAVEQSAVAEVASSLATQPAVACVGPHSPSEFK